MDSRATPRKSLGDPKWGRDPATPRLRNPALGHISPSIIGPDKLRALLVDISDQIPPYLELPEDPVEELWEYYRFLSCKTILMEDRIAVIISVPLLDVDGIYEIYDVVNLPIPHSNHTGMTIHFRLEAEAVAINRQRTRYTLLDSTGLSRCNSKIMHFCDIKNSIYPISRSKSCVLALFLKDKENIGERCVPIIRQTVQLLMARYITQGLWVISTQELQRFNVICQHSKVNTKTVTINPPFGVLRLEMACWAGNSYLTLRPYYRDESTYEGNEVFSELLAIGNTTSWNLWEPFNKDFPKFKREHTPAELRAVEEVPLSSVRNRVKHLGGGVFLSKIFWSLQLKMQPPTWSLWDTRLSLRHFSVYVFF